MHERGPIRLPWQTIVIGIEEVYGSRVFERNIYFPQTDIKYDHRYESIALCTWRCLPSYSHLAPMGHRTRRTSTMTLTLLPSDATPANLLAETRLCAHQLCVPSSVARWAATSTPPSFASMLEERKCRGKPRLEFHLERIHDVKPLVTTPRTAYLMALSLHERREMAEREAEEQERNRRVGRRLSHMLRRGSADGNRVVDRRPSTVDRWMQASLSAFGAELKHEPRRRTSIFTGLRGSSSHPPRVLRHPGLQPPEPVPLQNNVATGLRQV